MTISTMLSLENDIERCLMHYDDGAIEVLEI